MKTRLLYLLLTLLSFSLQAHAVLKEKDLEQTLSILRTELQNSRLELERQSGLVREQQEQVRNTLLNVLNRSNQNSLMLYSQKSDYIFDLTYACHEATEQYHEFQRNVLPFRKFIDKTSNEIARYDGRGTDYTPVSVGISVLHEIRYHNVSLSLGLGRYLYDNDGLARNKTFYQLVCGRYYLPSLGNTFVGIVLKAHKFRAAESVQLSVGKRF